MANEAIAKLLQVGWSTSFAARAAADNQVREVAAVARSHPEVLYSVALVMMYQRRYDDAQKRIDQNLAADDDHLPSWRAKTWLCTLTKNYPAAYLAADKLSQLLPAEESGNEEAEAAVREQVAFLGRIFGYLGGPAADGVNAEERKAAEKKIAGRLTAARRELFEEARDGVLRKYLELTDAKADTQERAKAAEDEEKEKALAELDQARKDAVERVAELKSRRDKLTKELNDELQDIAKEDRPLVAELARLEAQASRIRSDQAFLVNEISRLEALARREKDPALRNQYLREADRLEIPLARSSSDLAALDRLAGRVNSQRAALLARQQQAQNQYGGQIVGVDKELVEIDKSAKKADTQEKFLKRPSTGATAKGSALAAQARALATYESFPLEEERQRLLELLK